MFRGVLLFDHPNSVKPIRKYRELKIIKNCVLSIIPANNLVHVLVFYDITKITAIFKTVALNIKILKF